MVLADELEKGLFPSADLFAGYGVQMAVRTGIDAQHLVGDVQGLVEALFEQFGHSVSAIQLCLGGGVQVGSQLGEGLEFAESGQVQPQSAGYFLHRRDLGRPAHPRDRNPHVHRRALAGKEQVGL